MSRNLNQEEKERVRDRFGEHIFFRLVNQSCKKYERELKVFRLSPEDVFVEVLNVLDDMKARPENNADLCDTIWDNLYCSFRDRGEDIPEAELNKAVAVVISLVTYCLVLLNMTRYNSVVGRLNLLLNEQYKNHLEITLSINTYATKIGKKALYEWLSDYMQCDEYLSEEVEDCIDMEEAVVIKDRYRIAENHKTNFAKIISAMYELHMFEDELGKIASNKKQLICALGDFFGVNYNNLNQLLNSAKQNGNYTDIFDKLKEKAEKFSLK